MTAVVAAYILVGNDLDTLHVPGGLKDLSQDVFGDARIKTAYIQGALVWFGSSSTHKAASAGGGHHVAGHWRGDRSWNRIGVLRDHDGGKRRGRHVCWISLTVALGPIELLLTRGTCRGLGRGRKGRRSGGRGVFSHCVRRTGREEKKKNCGMEGWIYIAQREDIEWKRLLTQTEEEKTIIQAGSTGERLR